MKTKKMFEIEENASLLDFKFEDCDLPVWAFVRYKIIYASYCALFQEESKLENKDLFVSQKALLKYYLKSAWKMPFTYKQKDIVFLFTPVGDFLNNENKYENAYYSNFYLAAEKNSTIIQSPYNFNYTMPSIDKNIRFSGIINILIDKEKTEVSETDLLTIEHFISFLKKNICVSLEDKIFVEIKNNLLTIAAKTKPANKFYKKLYESVLPKAIVLDCAHYLGGYKPIISSLAKEKGIKVIEVQHGMAGNTHSAYNFGSAVLKDEYFLKCLPDYFLTYGDYCNTLINTPVNCITVGNPNFYRAEKKDMPVPNNTVLVLYNLPNAPDKCLSDYAIALAEKLPDYRITYRFHPHVLKSEKILKKLTSRTDLINLKIDKNRDIYDSLYENEYIIGGESSVLYEAACLKRKVYSLKMDESQNFLDENLFTVFETPGELIEKIKNNEGIIIDDRTKESIFASGFNERYTNFLSNIGIKI